MAIGGSLVVYRWIVRPYAFREKWCCFTVRVHRVFWLELVVFLDCPSGRHYQCEMNDMIVLGLHGASVTGVALCGARKPLKSIRPHFTSRKLQLLSQKQSVCAVE